MALTVTTDLTPLTTAESVTNWLAIGAQSPALEPDFFVQGNNCISRAVSGAISKGMVWDNTTALDFTTGTHKDKLVYIWMKSNTPGLCATRASAGVVVRLATGSATTNYRDWYVDGSDTLVAVEGWTCYVIDPQSAGTATSGSYSAASVRYFGGYMTTTTTAKGQNFGIDQISYGRGELLVSGTVTTAGAGFKEIAAVDFGTVGNRWGIVTEKQGIYFVRGKIILGHATSSTTFSSENETIVWETPSYYNGTSVVKSIPDASVGATAGSDGKTSYNGLGIIGGSGTTTLSFGTIVGSDNGRSGTLFSCARNNGLTTPGRTLATITADSSTMGLSIYGTTFAGFEGDIDLQGTGIDDDDCFNVSFDGCGRIDSNMELRNCKILNSVAAATDGAYLWSSTTNLTTCLFANCSRAVVFEATSGTPFTFTKVIFSGNTFDIRNESLGAITVNVSGGSTPTYEDIGGGSATTVSASVPVTITVVDALNVGVGTAQVAVYVGATQVLNTDTNGSGVAAGSWSGATPSNAIYKVRKASTGDTKYVAVSGPGVIAADTGLAVTVVLREDANA